MKSAHVVIRAGSYPDTGWVVAEETLEWGDPLKAPDTITVHAPRCDDSDCINSGCLTITLGDA